MKDKKALSSVLIICLCLLLLSCSQKAGVTTQEQEAISSSRTERPSQPAAGGWDKIISLAKREGRISVYADGGSNELRVPLTKALKEKFGLDLEFTSGRAAELTLKILNERKAGIYTVDVYIGGAATFVNDLGPSGIFEPLEPQLILPEVLDGKSWWGGEPIYVDKGRQVIVMAANPSSPLTINANLVKEEEVRSYLDLLNPRWKGKIIMGDPTTGGFAQNWFVIVSGKIMSVDFMRELARMDLMVTRDARLLVEWIAQGKYPVAIAASQATVVQFKKDGAPLKLITPKEGTYLTSGAGNMALVNKAPYPSAAKLLINWLLTREGQTLFSEAVMYQSTRLDVPTGHLDPASIRKEGMKYFFNIDGEFLRSFSEHAQVAKEIFGPVLK